MNIVNAIAKARFGSARPQRVQLHKGDGLRAELLCMEPGQELKVGSGQWVYYVVTGTATLTAATGDRELPTGQFAASDPKEKHTVANASERRLICLSVGK
jgi:quercetin dioxygenase-like cupin family protein